MPEYKLELKQLVDYPRCRIYRQYIRTLVEDRSIRVSGGSGLFYYTALCSYANFRTSYKRIDGISYTIYPGEWICKVSEIAAWFRTRFHHQALSILDALQQQHYITYTKLGRGNLIKFKIKGWQKFNKVLDYNAPCQKDAGFFFMPINKATELVSSVCCSEMDIVLDLWINTVYNEKQVQGSESGPVAYLRNGTGNPLVGYADLAQRWGISKSTVGRILTKLSDMDYISLLSFPGRHGSVIYLKNYLSTMFDVADVLVDKEEIAMSLNIHVSVSEDEAANGDICANTYDVSNIDISVSESEISVPESHIKIALSKTAQILAAGGFYCCECPHSKYKLSNLSGSKGNYLDRLALLEQGNQERFLFEIYCKAEKRIFAFELTIALINGQEIKKRERLQ